MNPALSPEQIQVIIAAHISRGRPEIERWDRYIRMYFGDAWGTGDSNKDADGYAYTEVNYPYAYIDSLISQVVPPNPACTITPYDADKNMEAKYREALVNSTFKRRKLRRKLWRHCSFASTCGRGVMKALWSGDLRDVTFKTIDPRNFFFDRAAEDWEDIRYAIEAVVMTKEEFHLAARRPLNPDKPNGKKAYNPDVVEKANFTSYPSWARPAQRDDEVVARDLYGYVVVYEVHDFVGGRMHHVLKGVNEPLMTTPLPYRFLRNPYHLMTFNECLQGISGLSDIQLIDKLQRLLNELDTIQLRHAQATIPVTLYLTDLLDDPDTFESDLLEASSPGDAVGLKRNSAVAAGMGVGDIVGHTPTATMGIDFEKIRARIISTIEFVLGLSQYQRGVVGVADVATEVALADTANRTRNGRRMAAVNDTIEFLAKAVVALYEEFMPSNSTIPIRLTGHKESLRVTREHLALRNGGEDSSDGKLAVEAMEWDYDVVPYSPTEDSNAVQLKNMVQFLEFLKQSPAVHQDRFDAELLSKLRINPAVLKTAQEKEEAAEALAVLSQLQSGAGAPKAGDPDQITSATQTAGGVTAPLAERGALDMPAGTSGGPGVDGNAPG